MYYTLYWGDTSPIASVPSLNSRIFLLSGYPVGAALDSVGLLCTFSK